MAITRYAGDKFYGLESEKDILLTQVMDGATYYCSDSLIIYIKINGFWIKTTGAYLSGAGTSGVLSKFVTSDTLSNTTAPIFESNSNVGIGTTTPISKLTIGASGSTVAISGLTFGVDSGANLYRSAASTIKTDGNFYASGSGNFISGVYSSGNIVVTGSVVRPTETGVFATATNLASTGSTLTTSITNLSGTLTAGYATIANLASTGSTLVTNLASTGSTLTTSITNLSGTLTAGYATIANLASTGSTLVTNLASTGSTLTTRITALSGTLTGGYATITNLASTGSTLTTSITNLSGTLTAGYATIANLASTGSTLVTNLASTGSTLTTSITNLSGTLTGGYATIANLASTGSTLVTNLASTGSILTTSITNLSGTLTGGYATIANLASTGSTLVTNLASTGSTLNTKINTLSGYTNATFLVGQADSGYLLRWSGSIGTRTLTSAIIFDNGSQIGIKADSLAYLLTVGASGSTAAASGLSLGGDASANLYRSANATVKTDGNFIAAGSGNFSNGVYSSGNILVTGSVVRPTETGVFATATNLASTGSTLVTNLASTGSTLTTSIINLSGTLTAGYATIANLASTGSTLVTNLASTGSTLTTSITNLSGTLTGNYATITNLASTGAGLNTRLISTGSTLTSSISNLSGTLTSNYALVNETRPTYQPFLSFSAVEGEASSQSPSVWGGFLSNQLTHWTKRGGSYTFSYSGGASSFADTVHVFNPNLLNGAYRQFSTITRNGTGPTTGVWEFTGISIPIPSDSRIHPFLIRRYGSDSDYTNIKFEVLDNSGIWTTTFDAAPAFSGALWSRNVTYVANYPVKGVRFTTTIASGSTPLYIAELGVWGQNFIKGSHLYAFQHGSNTLGVTSVSGALTIAGATTTTSSVSIGTATSTTLLTVGASGSTTAASGLTFGVDPGANLYRSAASTIKTDGNLIVAQNLTVTSHLSAATKSFLIDHPIKIGKKLQYGVLEGPEHSVYIRGKMFNSNFINFPDYWNYLVDLNSITASITPIGNSQNLFVQEINCSGVIVAGEALEKMNYYYHVFGERKDVPKIQIEI